MSLGIYIGRLNPPHIWHIWVIDKALEENEKVLILLWTWKKIDKKNPFNFEERKDLLDHVYGKINKLKILELKDKYSDLEWIKDILNIVWKYWNWIKNINFYWWDFENDSAYLVMKQYEVEFKNYNITYKEISRKLSLIEHNWKKYEVSATNLREALRNKDFNLSEKFCDKQNYEKIKSIF